MQIEFGRDLVRRGGRRGRPRRRSALPVLLRRSPLPRAGAVDGRRGAGPRPAARMYVESARSFSRSGCCRARQSAAPSPPRPGLSPAVLRRAKEFLHDEMNRNPGSPSCRGGRDERRSLLAHVQAVDRAGAPSVPGNIRLERAKRLLAEGRTPIIEIAYEIGYANPSQFSAFFRKRTGLSPTEFRRSAQTVRI